MAEWVGTAPVMMAAAVVVFGPGLVALASIGLRGLALAAGAPLFSIAVTAFGAIVFGVLGIDWTPLTWLAASLVAAALAWVFGRVLGPAVTARLAARKRRWLLPAGIFVGIMIGMVRLTGYIEDPAGISQTNDAVFHLNAIRYILETANASSLHVSSVIGANTVYPAAWHGIASLVVLISGAPIPVAVNALTVVIGAVIWPLGVAWLARAVSGSSAVATYAAVLSSGLQVFPLLMFQWGVLYPNALSVAVLPAAIALVISLPFWGSPKWPWRSVVSAVLLLLVAAAALLLSQPAAILPWAAVVAVWASFRLLHRSRRRRLAAVTAIVALWVALAAIWVALSRGTTGSHWPPFRGKFEAIVDVLLNGQLRIPFAFAISFLMLVGLVASVLSARMRWFAVAWLGIAGLYVLVASVGSPFVRTSVLGAWYADPNRIAAIAPVIVIPMAAIGAHALSRAVGRAVRRDADSTRTVLVTLSIVTVVMLAIAVFRPAPMPAFTQDIFDTESRYVAAADSYLSPDERLLLERLDQYVDDGDRVIGNPSTGTGFGYFISGVDVYPRTWAPPRAAAWQTLATSLRDVGEEPAVCDALAAYDYPEFVLDFGEAEPGPGRYEMPGLTGFEGQDGFEPVAEEGDASLWRITACAQ